MHLLQINSVSCLSVFETKTMAKKATYSIVLLMAAFTTMLAGPALSQLQPTIPVLRPGNGTAVIECWSSLMDVPGCVHQVYKSIHGLEFSNIGSGCCKAFLGVNGNCLPKMFPFDPLVPPLLYAYCLLNPNTLQQ